MDRLAARVEAVSARLLGAPYIANLLIGSAEVPEVFRGSLKGFDCVTYVETVLARALAGESRPYRAVLQRLRYKDGKVAWRQRNHYMTGWIRNNVRGGFLRRVGAAASTTRKDRILNVVPGLAPHRERFACVPKRALSRIDLQSGDLIFFVSTRAHLDVFHCGFLVWKDGRLLLRHASRTQGRVLEEELSAFLDRNRMAGVLLARPIVRSVQ